MKYTERAQGGRIQQHLEAALEEDDSNLKNRHIRESLQLLEALAASGD